MLNLVLDGKALPNQNRFTIMQTESLDYSLTCDAIEKTPKINEELSFLHFETFGIVRFALFFSAEQRKVKSMPR